MKRIALAALIALVATNAQATMPGWATKILQKHFNESSTQNADILTFDCRASDPAVSPTGKGQLFCLTGTGLRFSISGGAWGTVSGAGGGGSITAVGPGCSTGACFTDGLATTGTTFAIWEGTTADGIEINFIMPTADPTGQDINITFPSVTGELAITTVVPAAYATSAHTHLLGDCTAAAWFDGTAACNALIFEGSGVDGIEGTLSGGNPTAIDKTWTLPNETGNICTDSAGAGCLSNGYGNVNGAASSTDNAFARMDGTTGKLIQNSASTLSDAGDAVFIGTVTATEFIAGVRTCATNTDCNSIKVSFNSGAAGQPTCATQGETGKYSLVPYDDDTLHICQGTTDLGAWNGGDITAVGGCATGACFTNDVATGTSTSWFIFEGNTIDGFQHRLIIPIGEPVSGQAYDWTLPATSATVATEAATNWWSPTGLAWNSTSATPVDDQCSCWAFTLPAKMTDIDDVMLRVDAARTSAETVDFAVYSMDGATQYLECALTTSVALNATAECTTGNDIVSPAAMWPGKYWFCTATNDGGVALALRWDGSFGNDVPMERFTQTCAGGEAPATLTSPSATWVDTRSPGFVITDQ